MGSLTLGHFHTQTQGLMKWQMWYSKDFSDLISTSIWTQPIKLALKSIRKNGNELTMSLKMINQLGDSDSSSTMLRLN